MPANIFAILKAEYEYMSRVERQIADRILNDPQGFVSSSLAELAVSAEVSQGSIVNFSKKYSTGGFSALKAVVTACLKSETDTPFAVIDKSQGVKAAMELKIRENMIAFQNTLALNDEETLKRVVDKILSAKKIEIYGIFNSGIVATSFYNRDIQPDKSKFDYLAELGCQLYCTSVGEQQLKADTKAYEKCAATSGHIVIRVAPKGGSYMVYTLDDSDSKYRVTKIDGPFKCH